MDPRHHRRKRASVGRVEVEEPVTGIRVDDDGYLLALRLQRLELGHVCRGGLRTVSATVEPDAGDRQSLQVGPRVEPGGTGRSEAADGANGPCDLAEEA